jgi:hypothetical protein
MDRGPVTVTYNGGNCVVHGFFRWDQVNQLTTASNPYTIVESGPYFPSPFTETMVALTAPDQYCQVCNQQPQSVSNGVFIVQDSDCPALEALGSWPVTVQLQ